MTRLHPTLACLLVLLSGIGVGGGVSAEETPTPAPDPDMVDTPALSGFTLDVDTAAPDNDGNPADSGFRLFENVKDETPTAVPSSHDPDSLTLSRRFDDGHRRSDFEDFFEKLEVDRWPDGMGRREQMLAREQLRVVEGGLLGFPAGPGSALMIDPEGAGRLAKQLWRALTGSSPARASGSSVALRVENSVGRAPSMISVLPEIDGSVGDLFRAGCDGGRCVLAAMPAHPATMLVIGDGAALVQLNGEPGEIPVQLKPVGVLRLKPSGNNGSPRVRISDADTGTVVPVAGWKNPDRGEWVEVGRSGLSLQLPEGRYKVEVPSAGGNMSVVQATVVEGTTTVKSVP